ncbi:hypothetical protein [Reinekea sp. G2M2-21]|uniref:hypothetical protein n=1 Tax=Reinekea sp. G2M2-21 TaxID=2788942 RepID=UPI0018A98395|nr:hypothetical protein [Reinekea sp. G2M2-21]
MSRILIVSLLGAVVISGCETAGDGKGDVTLNLEATQGARSFLRTAITGVPVTDSNGLSAGTIDLTDAWVVVKEIEFEHEDDEETADSDQSKLEFIGPYAVDLLTGTTYPALPQISIDTGLYTDIEIDIEKLSASDVAGMTGLDSAIATKLENYSIYLDGTYNDGVNTIDFTLMYDQTDEFEFSPAGVSSNGFNIDDEGINDILVAFRLNEWFRFDNAETNNGLSVDFSDAVSGTDPIVLDANTNSDVMDVIEDNIEDSAEYGEDDNDDGVLSDDEDDNDD